jgi:biopolymer transport protein ExbD
MSKVPQLWAQDIGGENMRTRTFALITMILLSAAFVSAQPGGKKPVAAAGTNQATSDFEFEVTITPMGLAGVTVRKRSGMGLFTPAMLSGLADQSAKNSLSRTFVIRPDKAAKMEYVIAAINALRSSSKTDVRIEIDTDLNVSVPKKPDPNAIPRPNPLFLLVNIDERSNISLNGEKEGIFPDTAKVEQHLNQIFQDRAKNGISDTAVVISLAKGMTFANLVDIARAIKRGGSDAVSLQVDESGTVLEMEIIKP